MDEEGVKDVADIFEKERPARAVERKHLAVATHLISRTGQGGDEKHRAKCGQHHGRDRHVLAVPLDGTLYEEGYRP